MAARLNSDASDLELSESPYVFMADAGRGETERAMKGVATGSLRAEEIALERVQRHHRDAPAPAVKPSERPRGNRASSERAPLSPASTDGDTDVEGQCMLKSTYKNIPGLVSMCGGPVSILKAFGITVAALITLLCCSPEHTEHKHCAVRASKQSSTPAQLAV